MAELTEIQKHMLKTFLWLRIGIGAIGILFPFWLWGVGGAVYHLPLADSMSAYYHATTWCMDPRSHSDASQCVGHVLLAGAGPMRDWFVGILFAIGVGLALIKGFSVWEDWMLTIAGALAVVVATNPMPWLPAADTGWDIHYIAAITFFVLIGLTIWFCSGKTLKFMPDIPNKEKWIKFFSHHLLRVRHRHGRSPGPGFSGLQITGPKAFSGRRLLASSPLARIGSSKPRNSATATSNAAPCAAKSIWTLQSCNKCFRRRGPRTETQMMKEKRRRSLNNRALEKTKSAEPEKARTFARR